MKATQWPELDALLPFGRDADTVVVHSMGRLARNLDDLRRLVQSEPFGGVKRSDSAYRLADNRELGQLAPSRISIRQIVQRPS